MQTLFFSSFIFPTKDSKNHPVQRNAANARERARMRVLSSAFCRLKTKLPWVPADTKLSKLDTLRLATIYIRQLRMRLATDDDSNTENSFSKFDNLPIMNNDQQCLVSDFYIFIVFESQVDDFNSILFLCRFVRTFDRTKPKQQQ